MRVNFGHIIDSEMWCDCSKDYLMTDLPEAARLIAADYIKFKKVVDHYGYSTFLELTEEYKELPGLIDSHLDGVLGTNLAIVS